MIHYREQQPASLHGETVWVPNSDEAHVVTYLRRTAEEELLIAVNLSNTPFRGTVESAGSWTEVDVPLRRFRHNTGEPGVPSTEVHAVALPALSLDAFGFRIFHRNTKTATPAAMQ